jgi:hypothetical protein
LSRWHFRLSLNLTMPALGLLAAGFRTDNRESDNTYGNSNGDTAAASRLRIVDRNDRQADGDGQDDKRFCSLMEHEPTPPRALIGTSRRGRIRGGEQSREGELETSTLPEAVGEDGLRNMIGSKLTPPAYTTGGVSTPSLF